MPWTLISTPEYRLWKSSLNEKQSRALADRILTLKLDGPHATRPYFDTLRGSKFPNLREIIVTKKEQRVIYIFDPHQQAVLLLGGDKSQDHDGWYDEHIPEAEAVYREYLEATDRTPYEEE